MVLPQAMAWVQYWFRVLSLKFCGKSKKNCGDISQVSPTFCMYASIEMEVKWTWKEIVWKYDVFKTSHKTNLELDIQSQKIQMLEYLLIVCLFVWGKVISFCDCNSFHVGLRQSLSIRIIIIGQCYVLYCIVLYYNNAQFILSVAKSVLKEFSHFCVLWKSHASNNFYQLDTIES